MIEYKIVPDVITIPPCEIIEVSYPSGVSVNIGNELTPTQVKYEPSVNWPADPNAFYTLCMIDPDAPNREEHTFREWDHWLVGNIPGHDISKGQILSEYIGPEPPLGTGLHRYVFLAYQQPSKLTFNEPYLTNKSGENRGKFSIAKFAVKYNLENPVAGNFYQAQYDDYVPLLPHKQPAAQNI